MLPNFLTSIFYYGVPTNTLTHMHVYDMMVTNNLFYNILTNQFIKICKKLSFSQVLVVCFTVFGGLMAFNYHRALQVWAIPLLLVAFFAYLVAHSFLSVFETVLDALFLCFAVDLETNDGSSEKPYFMDQEILVSRHFISCCNLHLHKSVENWRIREAHT